MPTVVQLADAADPAQVAFVGGQHPRRRLVGAGPSAASTASRSPPSTTRAAPYRSPSAVGLGPYSLPSTVVLDREGRLAALVLGEIPGARTMQEVIDDVVAEGA